MNCDGVQGLLSAYLDGELSSGELLRVEQHLRRCHCCADEVDSLRQTIALVASLDEVDVPTTFRAQLQERLIAIGPPTVPGRLAAPSWQRNVRRWAVPAAAAAAALAIGLTNLQHAKDLPGLPGGGQIAVDTSAVGPSPGQVSSGSGNDNSGTGSTKPPPDGGKSNGPVADDGPTGTTGIGSGANVSHGGGNGNSDGSQPPVKPPSSTGPGTGDANVVTTPGGETTPRDKLPPQLTYQVQYTVTAEHPDSVKAALQSITGPVETQENGWVAVMAKAGYDVRKADLLSVLKVSEPASSGQEDLAAQIQAASLALADRQTALQNFDDKVSQYTDQADRDMAKADREGYVSKVQQADESLKRLQSQVGMVVITVRLQSQSR